MGCQEELLIEKVCEIYGNISVLANLSPSKHVNSLFTQLVHICMPQCQIDITKLSERIQEIRSKLIKLCGQAEGLLESHFSTIIGSHENPLHHIRLFPYYSNYLKLSQLEFSMLGKHCTKVPNSVAFVGSGPLPLTTIILATNHFSTTCFHNYDIDPSANSQALQLVSSDPNLSERMFFHTANIMSVSSSLTEYEVVILAALVGMDKKEKVQVIKHLAEHMAPGAILLLRSAHGARAFLYPVIDPQDLEGFEVLSVFHPTDEVINSVIIARKFLRAVHSLNTGIGSALLPSKCSDIQGFKPITHTNLIEELTVDEQQSEFFLFAA
ncbi:nicotianamine synthase [Ricinus communis]|uniref:Nicotianamine synthase n=1 Tax=Ricinus communis TaxID=3988 RepID=B9RZP0_RICCO|nr:nicotianamine synthase [Ricinus communis]EEF43073.1 Nicotianamine synthase, putative [Ricinus communis]|eukprot:XP_002519209.1 nicotianamine synthase [Ricinus communis]